VLHEKNISCVMSDNFENDSKTPVCMLMAYVFSHTLCYSYSFIQFIFLPGIKNPKEKRPMLCGSEIVVR
jgi:hypothetical protein